MRHILADHLRRYREDLEQVRQVYPETLWQVNWETRTEQRVEWLLHDILAHLRAYAAEQERAVSGKPQQSALWMEEAGRAAGGGDDRCNCRRST